ncbi:MAG: hypothetical protein LBD79_05325 [Treponema sp.]|nr:hypothetical protein [Treponema sp.]
MRLDLKDVTAYLKRGNAYYKQGGPPRLRRWGEDVAACSSHADARSNLNLEQVRSLEQ